MKKKADKKRGIIQKNIIIVLIIALLAAIFMLCMGYYKKATYIVKNPIATIEVENYGTMKIELYPDQAPNTVNNFITLANNQFYDGLTFHRIIKNFIIDNRIEKKSDSDKEYNIDGEFMNNDFESNTLKLGNGVIAMARNDFSSYAYYYPTLLKKGYNTAGSQFFIMTTDDYTSLTRIICGIWKGNRRT